MAAHVCLLIRFAWICGLFYLLLDLLPAHAIIDRAAILPHGDEAFDPSRFAPGTDSRRAADLIAKAAHDTGWWLREDDYQPSTTNHSSSLLFVSSPHGVALTNNFAVYLGDIASGSAVIGAPNAEYSVAMSAIQMNRTRAMQLIEYLHHPNVSGFDLSETPLRWGEIIPLLFTKQPSRPHLFWTFPLRRFNESLSMIPELLAIGERLRVWFEHLPELVSIIISGDLSHRHRADGPYGFSPTSRAMDDALGRWASNPCENANDLLRTAGGLQAEALSCGFTGFVLLHGILCGNKKNELLISSHSATSEWSSRVLVNRNATYFGMMVAQIERKRSIGDVIVG